MTRSTFFGSECKIIRNLVHKDLRGEFNRISDSEWLASRSNFAQVSFSRNHSKFTLRGLHYQGDEGKESKIISCLSGAIFDVAVDIRKESKTYLHWDSCIVKGEDKISLLVPPGFAHGFLTLEDNTDIIYSIDVPFNSLEYAGINPFSQKINIKWPMHANHISTKDASLPESPR